LDTAVGQFGRALENELAGVEGKGKSLKVKRERVLRKWLDLPMQYRDPAKSGHAPVAQ
jgi:hypothetical protein